MMWHILQNGWEDKEFIRQRVYGLEDVREEVEKWPPEEVERVTGLPEAQVKRVAEMFATGAALDADLGDGSDPVHHRDRECSRQLPAPAVTGNVGGFGSGANIFRGHTTFKAQRISAST